MPLLSKQTRFQFSLVWIPLAVTLSGCYLTIQENPATDSHQVELKTLPGALLTAAEQGQRPTITFELTQQPNCPYPISYTDYELAIHPIGQQEPFTEDSRQTPQAIVTETFQQRSITVRLPTDQKLVATLTNTRQTRELPSLRFVADQDQTLTFRLPGCSSHRSR